MVFIKHNSLKSDIFVNPIFIPGFSGSSFFKIQVSQGPGFSGSGSRVQVQVLEVATQKSLLTQFIILTSYAKLREEVLVVVSLRNSLPQLFCKKGVLRNLVNSQGNTCARVSFLIKLQASSTGVFL